MPKAPDRGVALVIVMMTMLLLTVLGAGLVLTTSAETLIAWNFRGSQQALYAADAAGEWALVDLAAVTPDWPTLLNGSARSWFVDGVAAGKRVLADGSLLDLTAVVQQNAGWRPYAYGPLKDLLPTPPPLSPPSAFYVLVSVAPDAASASRLRVRAEAFGPRGAHKTVELGVLRDGLGVQLQSWTEVR